MAEQYEELYSCTVLDAGGSRIGSVSQVYLDDATGEPTFVTARAGLFGNKEVMVPLAGAFVADGLMQVPHTAELVKQAPAPRTERRLTPDQEAEIYGHYGLSFSLPEPEPVSTQTQAPTASAVPSGETPQATPQ